MTYAIISASSNSWIYEYDTLEEAIDCWNECHELECDYILVHVLATTKSTKDYAAANNHLPGRVE